MTTFTTTASIPGQVRFRFSGRAFTIVDPGVDLQPGTQRAFKRYAFVASAEVTETVSGTRLSARTSDLGLGGCYIDSLNTLPTGTQVKLRILKDQGEIETEAKVVYSDPRFGMGLAFAAIEPEQRSRLETWLSEAASISLEESD